MNPSLASEISKLIPSHKGFMVYGSVIYGTNHEGSDVDVLVLGEEEKEITLGSLSLHIVTEESFKDKLKNCDIVALECVFSPQREMTKDYTSFIDWTKLRSSLSEKASHSFAKAGKKIDVEKEIYLGKKSLFHALRILTFARKLALNHAITDFKEANHLYSSIMSKEWSDWASFKKEYKPVYNSLHSEFKKITSS